MNLYHLTQNKVDDYDTYSDAVVAAQDECRAKLIHPSSFVSWDEAEWKYKAGPLISPRSHGTSEWPEPEHVEARLIGVAVEGTVEGVICASFHAS